MPQKRSKNNTESKNKKISKWKNNGKSGASTNPERRLPKKQLGVGSQMRSKAKIKLLNLYREKPDIEKMNEQKVGPARVDPDRKWFGNIRTIDQKDLDKYKAELAVYQKNPYSYMLKNKKVDLGIFTKANPYNKNRLTDVEKF